MLVTPDHHRYLPAGRIAGCIDDEVAAQHVSATTTSFIAPPARFFATTSATFCAFDCQLFSTDSRNAAHSIEPRIVAGVDETRATIR